MGKRQIRIFEKDIPEKLNSLLQLELNLILKNNVVLHGKIIARDKNNIRFKDMILRKYPLRIDEISEIILDKESEF